MSEQQGSRPGSGRSSYPQGGPQHPGDSPVQGPRPGWPGPGGGPPAKKSPLLVIGIVVAAVVALVAIGAIVIGLTAGGRAVPETTITPGPQNPPDDPSASPASGPTTPSGSTTAGGGGSSPALDVGHDVRLVPATGWDVQRQGTDLARLSDGRNVYVGQTSELDPGSNAGQVCTAWHKQLAESEGGGRFSTPRTVDVGAEKLGAATCSAQVTVSNGQGSSELLLVSLVSVRSTDGITVVGSIAFTKGSDQDQLQKDFAAMTGSMLQAQADG